MQDDDFGIKKTTHLNLYKPKCTDISASPFKPTDHIMVHCNFWVKVKHTFSCVAFLPIKLLLHKWHLIEANQMC